MVAGSALGSAAFGLAMTEVSAALARRAADPALIACATEEVRALALDLTVGGAATPLLTGAAGAHKRLWSAVGEGYVERARFGEFDVLGPCAHETAARILL